MPFTKPVVNGVGLLQNLKTICHEKSQKATMGLQGEKPENPCGSKQIVVFREDRSNEKDTVRLPWHYTNQPRNTP